MESITSGINSDISPNIAVAKDEVKKKIESLEAEIAELKTEISREKIKKDNLMGELKAASTPQDKSFYQQQITSSANLLVGMVTRLSGLEIDLRKLEEEEKEGKPFITYNWMRFPFSDSIFISLPSFTLLSFLFCISIVYVLSISCSSR